MSTASALLLLLANGLLFRLNFFFFLNVLKSPAALERELRMAQHWPVDTKELLALGSIIPHT